MGGSGPRSGPNSGPSYNSGPSSGQSSSSGKNPSSGSQSSGSQHTNKWGRKPPVCYYCGKAGHMIYDCTIKKRDESRLNSISGASPNGKPDGLVFRNKSVMNRSPVVDQITDQLSPKSVDVREENRPFVSVVSLSFVDCTANRVPIKILRDTGATQSLILRGLAILFEFSHW